jgi:hypothetical protein
MRKRRRLGSIVEAYLKMWPREVFDIRADNRLVPEIQSLLDAPGVYVLYRDDHPYYVGRATRRLRHRLHAHANRPKDKYYNFWNFFSAFMVVDQKHIPEVEGILIAAFPTENSATPRFKKLPLPARVARQIHARRLITTGKG